MAKFERRFNANYKDFITYIEKEVLNTSMTASLEGSSDFELEGVHTSVRIFERFATLGANRVSLSVTIVHKDDDIMLSAITSGGSQGRFMKINTVGEENFLAVFQNTVDKYIRKHK